MALPARRLRIFFTGLLIDTYGLSMEMESPLCFRNLSRAGQRPTYDSACQHKKKTAGMAVWSC